MVAAISQLQSGLFYWMYELKDLGECMWNLEQERRACRLVVGLDCFYIMECYPQDRAVVEAPHAMRH